MLRNASLFFWLKLVAQVSLPKIKICPENPFVFPRSGFVLVPQKYSFIPPEILLPLNFVATIWGNSFWTENRFLSILSAQLYFNVIFIWLRISSDFFFLDLLIGIDRRYPGETLVNKNLNQLDVNLLSESYTYFIIYSLEDLNFILLKFQKLWDKIFEIFSCQSSF